jgi:hypothetical protein
MTAPVVTVTPTILDGTVARWYHNETHLAWHRETISASRNGVMGHGTYITPDTFDAAWTAHLALKNGHDIGHLATHRRRGLTGPYEPIDALQAQR